MRGAICLECGEPVDRDVEFCTNCGAYLEWNATESGEEAAPVAVVRMGERPPPRASEAMTVPSPRTASASDPATAAQPAPAAAGGRGESDPRRRRTAEVPRVDAPVAGWCSRCGTDNPPELRFCRRCALEFQPATATAWQGRPGGGTLPWWRRLLGRGRTPGERAALRTYRRSLPTRYRVYRGLAALLAAVLVGLATWAVQGNPLRWAETRWDDLRDTVEPVALTGAALDPETAQPRTDFEPANAADGDASTAWATAWEAGEPARACRGERHTAEALVLRFRSVADVRKLRVLAGLPADDPQRQVFNRPRLLEVRSSDGTCQAVPLDDQAEAQVVSLKTPVSTDLLRIDVLDVYAGTNDQVALSEVVPLQRPPH
jgi:hypothetical protein